MNRQDAKNAKDHGLSDDLRLGDLGLLAVQLCGKPGNAILLNGDLAGSSRGIMASDGNREIGVPSAFRLVAAMLLQGYPY